MKQFEWKGILPHIAAVLVFLALTLVYFHPVLEGKDIRQADAVGSMGWGKDARDYHEESGEYSYWSNSMFSGMPCNYTFSPQPDNVFKPVGEVVTLNVFGASYRHIGCIFATFIGCYLLFLALGCGTWLSVAGSIVYTLGSYNFIIIGAGHMNKSLVIATMAPVIGGIILCYRRKLLAGALLTLLFAGLNVYWSHQQVSYYLLLMVVIMAIVYFAYAWREKWLKYYFKATGVLAVVALLAAAPAVGILLPTSDYAKESMRGGSELSASDGEKASGLDTEYAFAWSYGKGESMTLLVPNFYGASSHYNVGTGSGLYNTYRSAVLNNYVDMLLQSNPGVSEMDARRYIMNERDIMARVNDEAAAFASAAPTYWGDQPFTEGPVYAGAIVCFLFVLGLIIVKGPEKWWLLAVTIFSLVLAWGRNLPLINNFLFEYLPLYSKFRAPSMALVITTLSMSMLAVLAVKRFVQLVASENDGDKVLARTGLYVSMGVFGALLLFFALFGASVVDFTAPGDANMAQMPELYNALLSERASMLVADTWRSLAFIAAAFAVMQLYISRVIKKTVIAVLLLAMLFLFDMWPVSNRFLSSDSFIPKKETTAIAVTAADRQIKAMAGNDSHYRVFNLTDSPFNEAFTSYKHNSIGGYSPAKLARYQDLIETYLSKMNWNVISMLNTRFIITEDGVVENSPEYGLPGAFGNCWVVDNIEWVNGAKEEIAAIENVDKKVAYIDEAWRDKVADAAKYNNAARGEIVMTEYRNPGNIVYRSSCEAPKMAVFSEVYYKTWKAYIDGNEVVPLRANYVLRALPLPAGEHVIEFKCVDELMIESHRWSSYMSLLVGVVILALAGTVVYRAVKKR